MSLVVRNLIRNRTGASLATEKAQISLRVKSIFKCHSIPISCYNYLN